MGTREIFALDPGDMPPLVLPFWIFVELVVDVTVDTVLGALTQMTLFCRVVTFCEFCSGGGFCASAHCGVPLPLEDEVFSQEDLGINFGNFSMFKDAPASALDDSLERR